MGRHQPELRPHACLLAREVLARDVLPNGVVVSTVRLPGARPRYESAAFASGWPDRPGSDELLVRRTPTREAALAEHRALATELTGGIDTSDPDWVFKLLGLPPRRAASRS